MRTVLKLWTVPTPRTMAPTPSKRSKNAKVNAEGTDWFVSILSSVVTLFVGGALGGKYKNKAHLTLTTDDGTVKIWLVDADFQQAEKVAARINTKRTGTQ